MSMLRGSFIPTPVRRLVGHELRVLAGLAMWVARRRHGVRGAGDQAFGYARDQAAIMYGLTCVCVIEAYGMAVLLRNWPTAHTVMLVVDVYSVILMLGLHAASVTRPHVLSPDELRLRQGAHRDLRIPLTLIAAVRAERLFTHPQEPREPRAPDTPDQSHGRTLDMPVASTTSLTLELAEPVTDVGFLGKRREVTKVRLHADEPDRLLSALEEQLAAHPHAGAN
ncbi:hypothetical protein ACFVYR_12795 [Streptomyces sp. NPDC058284]|uniref:hypothetical protein n=1 Tax=unclassified Streptomyces TaxID=2593676 RepID=UPI00364D9AB8